METESSEKIRVLAVIGPDRHDEIHRQIASFGMEPVVVSRAAQLATLIREGRVHQVVLLPASLPNTQDWWAIWGELSALSPRPVILVYAPTSSFQLWSGVLEAGGHDVIVEPLTDAKLRDALLRAAESYDAPDKEI